MSKVLPDDDDLLEFPEDISGEEELVGTKDVDELILAEIADGPESVGLDVESGLEDRSDASDPFDADDEEAESALVDEAGLEFEDDLDLEDDGESFTQEGEGLAGDWGDDDIDLDDESGAEDDGGLEGLEDPFYDDLGLDEAKDGVLDADEENDEASEGELEVDDEFSLTLTEPRTRKG